MKLRKRWILLLVFAAVEGSLFAEIEITLNNDFIEQYKDRATISASFTVDKAHQRANPPKNDVGGSKHWCARSSTENRAEQSTDSAIERVAVPVHSYQTS